jgi:hypothetical protein
LTPHSTIYPENCLQLRDPADNAGIQLGRDCLPMIPEELHFILCGVSEIIGHHDDTFGAAFHQSDRVAQASPPVFRERRRYHRWGAKFVIGKPESSAALAASIKSLYLKRPSQ